MLYEKPFTLNARQARVVIDAARHKGVFVMEGMRTRFLPLVSKLQQLLHVDEVIGNVQRVFCDFGLDMPLATLPATSRLKDLALGAESLLDIGIYNLTWGLLTLEGDRTEQQSPVVTSTQTLSDGVDVTSSMLLFYPQTGRHGILTSTTLHKTDRTFCRIESSSGIILVSGDTAPMPDTITIVLKAANAGKDMGDRRAEAGVKEEHFGGEKEVFRFAEHSVAAKGFYHEADHVALRLAGGYIESDIIPLSETLKVLEILDGVRKQGGALYPQDNE